MNQQSDRTPYKGDKWVNGRSSFWPLRVCGAGIYGIERDAVGHVSNTYYGSPLSSHWTLAETNSTPPPLSGEPLPERPKERPSRIGHTARELYESGDGPREGDEFERVTTSGMAPAYWVGYGFELNAHSNGEIRHGDGVTTLDCYRLTREGVSEADFRARWGKESRIGKTFGELKETRKGDVWDDGVQRVLVDSVINAKTRYVSGSFRRSPLATDTSLGSWWIPLSALLIAEGRDESNWLDGVEGSEEPEPDDTPLAESRRQFDAALEEADPMETVGRITMRRSRWRAGMIDVLGSGEVAYWSESVQGLCHIHDADADSHFEFKGNDARTLRALFGVEPLE